MKIILQILFILLPCLISSKQIRAVWVDARQFPNETTTGDIIKILHENGINRIYVGIWKNGKVYYESETMRNAIGDKGFGVKMLKWAVKYGKLYNLEVYGWFEYGYMAAYNNLTCAFGQYALKLGWVMGQCDEFYYMDPRTGATDFLVGILDDAIKEGVDGLQFDDHFACPPKFPQCSIGIVTAAAKFIKDNLKNKYKEKMVPISIAPGPMPEALRDYNVDWRGMMIKGYFDEVIPLLYTNNSEYFKSRLLSNERYWPEFRQKVLTGIMVNGDGYFILTKWSEVLKMINFATERGYGISIWYAKSVAFDYRKEFHELWGK